MSAEFVYEGGLVVCSISQMTGDVAENCAHSIQLENTGNQRIYKEYVLVDEVKDEEEKVTTYVILSHKDVFGYVAFSGVSESDIQAFLDTVVFDTIAE